MKPPFTTNVPYPRRFVSAPHVPHRRPEPAPLVVGGQNRPASDIAASALIFAICGAIGAILILVVVMGWGK